jgi:hypothetical protein
MPVLVPGEHGATRKSIRQAPAKDSGYDEKRQTEVTDTSPFKTYTCVLLDTANNVLRMTSDDYATETAAIKHAAIAVFLNEAAAGYELWHRLRKVARFMKPRLGRA